MHIAANNLGTPFPHISCRLCPSWDPKIGFGANITAVLSAIQIHVTSSGHSGGTKAGDKADTGPRIAPIPKKALTRLLTLQEPERSFQWLQSLSEEDLEVEIIQIALWAAYQPCFDKADVPLLRAADFIKNFATTFQIMLPCKLYRERTKTMNLKPPEYRTRNPQ